MSKDKNKENIQEEVKEEKTEKTEDKEDYVEESVDVIEEEDTAKGSADDTKEEDIGKKEDSEVEKLKKELEQQKDKYMRLCAEYDNYRKRTQTEKLGIYDDATKHTVTELLPIADSVLMGLASMRDNEVPKEYTKGIELIADQLKKCFEKLDIEEFGEAGDKFDPALHNAVSKIEDENFEENTISAVYQKGFKLKDKIVRHAMVQVANCD